MFLLRRTPDSIITIDLHIIYKLGTAHYLLHNILTGIHHSCGLRALLSHSYTDSITAWKFLLRWSRKHGNASTLHGGNDSLNLVLKCVRGWSETSALILSFTQRPRAILGVLNVNSLRCLRNLSSPIRLRQFIVSIHCDCKHIR